MIFSWSNIKSCRRTILFKLNLYEKKRRKTGKKTVGLTSLFREFDVRLDTEILSATLPVVGFQS